MSLKVSTWNVNGIRARYAQVLEWVQREAPDVLCLQEIKSPPDKVPQEICSLTGYWCYWHGHKGYSGVGLHLRRDLFPDNGFSIVGRRASRQSRRLGRDS